MSTLKRAGNVLTEQDKTDIRRDIGLGTAAQLDVPASGNATSGQVVKGSDTRLSDARTPTSHAHTASAITDFSSAADARIAAASINALADVAVTSPSTGQVLKWNGSAWVNDTDAGGAGATNLTYTASPTGGTVNSDTGTDASVPLSDGTNAGLMAPAQHTKLAGIAASATANATDAQLRDRATHTGTQSAATITGLATVATTGAYADLTGKPTLGTAAATDASAYATAAQGTDSREWTAATVDQAEAEAGTATTRKAWTAQRVAQAIAAQVAAWWTSISTAAGRALVTAADAAAQRSALGLGTAATTAASAYATAAQAVPAGGTTGQVLAKTSGTDYATAWTTPSGGGTPGGSSLELQINNAGSFGSISGSSWTAATSTMRLPASSKLWLDSTHATGIQSDVDGYYLRVKNRYGNTFTFGSNLALPQYAQLVWGADNGLDSAAIKVAPQGPSSGPSPGTLNTQRTDRPGIWLAGQYGGAYASSTNYHHGTGASVWCGYGATPTTTNAAGGDAGNFDVWLNAGGAGNGTGAAGQRGRLRVVNDATDAEVWSVDQLGNMVQSGGTFKPPQYTTATRPAWVNGAVIFDTDIDKVVIGGVSGWEAVTST